MTGTASCRCGARWYGPRIAHCTACHRTFGSVQGFDKHRIGRADIRTCRSATEMAALGYQPNAYRVWRIPRPDDTLPYAPVEPPAVADEQR